MIEHDELLNLAKESGADVQKRNDAVGVMEIIVFGGAELERFAALISSQPAPGFNEAIAMAAEVCDQLFFLRKIKGFPREASTALQLGEEIRSLDCPSQAQAPVVSEHYYVQPVPDHCNRITWRNSYYHLPINSSAQSAKEAPYEAIGRMLAAAMEEAVKNGANSISMPDEYVKIAVWLAEHQQKEGK